MNTDKTSIGNESQPSCLGDDSGSGFYDFRSSKFNKNKMENFFYYDRFCSDISDLMDVFDIDDENLAELEDDWSVTCEETTLEKMFVIKKEFAINAIVNKTDTWEDRFPEESDDLFKRIEKAISDAIDIEKLNEALPSLYYPNGKKFKVTKADLVEYCS